MKKKLKKNTLHTLAHIVMGLRSIVLSALKLNVRFLM